jgi:hypothetical protein
MRISRKVAIAGVLFGAVAMTPGTARADGGIVPSQAPRIVVGQTTFGNTDFPDNSGRDYYRLPSLKAQSVVTVAGRFTGRSGVAYACLAGNIDDFSWDQAGCNWSEYDYISRSGSRIRLESAGKTNSAYLRITGTYGPYEFNVEKIQHKLGMALKGDNTFKRNERVTVSVRMTDGAPVPDGLLVSIITQVGGRNYRENARTRGGIATFTLHLPASAENKRGVMIAFSDEKPQYLPARAAARSITIVK